jgi:sodium transport system ATP-binding protein
VWWIDGVLMDNAAHFIASDDEMPDTSELVVAEGLTKVYEGARGTRTLAVDDVSFTCRAGEVFGLLGPNGAGKTTTLRMLSTVLRPTRGTAHIAGHDVVEDAGAVRSAIGFLSGNTGLYGRLTPREMLRYFGRMYGLSEDRIARRTNELADLFDMQDFLDKRCDALSSGMKQKVNVARTVLHDPPVLILDEPTVGLDVLTSRTIVDFVTECRTQGKCVIFSTHIMGEVSRLCDHLAIVHQGRIQFAGSLDELRARTGTDLEHAFLSVLEKVA